MEYTDTDLQKACDIKQMAIIGKIHNMPWLKSNSQLSGHIKTLQGGTELRNNSFKNKINEETKERIEVVSTSTVSTSPKVNQIDNVLIKSLNEDDSIISKEDFVNLPQKDMETVWNEDVNVPSTLFPDSQCLVMQRLDEQERISMTLAESIVTVQLDQFRLTEEGQSKPTDSHNETDNKWDSVNDTSNLPKSDSDLNNQESSKQCHDNNNNNAKSKSQSTVETKKAVQRTTKVNTKKLTEQKTKKQSGNSLKEPYDISKQGSKSKDDLLNLCNDENKTATSTGESKKITVGISPKFIDKYNKVNGYNKQLIMGKATRTKEQQVFKSHFSTFNDSGNNSRSSIGGLDDKSKCVATKFKVCRNESDKKGNELDDTKRCHKVQATRTQSYNFQYNRSKTLTKSQQQQRYLKNVVKSEEISSIKNTSDCNNTASTSIENFSKKKCENQQSITNKQVSDIHSNHNVAGKSIKNSNVPECGISERNCGKSSSVSCKRNYQNLANTRNIVERNVKDDQSHTQKFKRDSNVYRRSTTVIPSFFKDLSGQAKTEDNKKNVSDNNSAKDYKVKPVSTVDAKVHCESEGSKVSVYSHKTSNGASNINKTDTLDSSTVNNVQSVKSLNSCSNNTKDSVIVNVSEELQVSQVSCNKTEVQFVKTEQENTSNNNSNNKPSTSNSDTKSVKFSDNVQEINAMHRSTPSYTDNSMHQNKIPINQFYSNLQNTCNTSNAQQMENHQNVQNKSYFDNNAAQYSNTTSNMQHTERDLQLLDVVQQKPDQTSHITPQNVLSQNNSNACIAMGNRLPYQSMPAMYLSQYNNTQNVPRKTADSTIISQNALISSTSSYNVESQNVLQNDPSTILMHNTQTSVLPPPGFHNHPVTTQHNQWNLPFPDMFLFGNMMNPAPSMNVQIQNSRHVCSTDYSNIQQTGYLQHPMFYVPPICMQSWNPLLQYPAPLFQNSPYANCNAYPNQVLSSANLVDSANCSVSTSIQNNTYKHFQPVQQIENSPNFSVPVKLDTYTGNIQGCKSNNIRMKDNSMEAHARANHYRASVSNEYQNCSQDGQLMVPFSYGIAMDSMARNCPPNVHMQMSQKYAPHALTTANYQRMPETCSTFQNNQNPHNRKDDVSKSDSDCIPPMVSPRECMYYGVNYSRKTDTVQNSSLRSDVKPVTYNIHSVNNQHYVPQYQRNNAIYHNSTPKELSTRVTMVRGIRKAMDQ